MATPVARLKAVLEGLLDRDVTNQEILTIAGGIVYQWEGDAKSRFGVENVSDLTNTQVAHYALNRLRNSLREQYRGAAVKREVQSSRQAGQRVKAAESLIGSEEVATPAPEDPA